MLRWWYILFPVPVKIAHQYDEANDTSSVTVTLVPLYHVLLPLIRRVVPTSALKWLNDPKPEPIIEQDGEHVCAAPKCD